MTLVLTVIGRSPYVGVCAPIRCDRESRGDLSIADTSQHGAQKLGTLSLTVLGRSIRCFNQAGYARQGDFGVIR